MQTQAKVRGEVDSRKIIGSVSLKIIDGKWTKVLHMNWLQHPQDVAAVLLCCGTILRMLSN